MQLDATRKGKTMDEVKPGRLISFRPSAYDVEVLNKFREQNPHLTDANELLRIIIRAADMLLNEQGRSSQMAARLEEIEKRIRQLEEK